MSQEALPAPENFSRVEDFRVLMALPRPYRVTIAYERLMKTAILLGHLARRRAHQPDRL
jgi:hypothetical protein